MFHEYEPSSLGATKVVHCAINRTQPCDVILSKTVTSCCHEKRQIFLSKYLCLIRPFRAAAVGVVMIDFKKAFDLVDRKILLQKLKHYKLSDKTMSWFDSYYIENKEYVLTM